jgi:hypothetical protein
MLSNLYLNEVDKMLERAREVDLPLLAGLAPAGVAASFAARSNDDL